jgi:hypothetical protein
MNSRVELLYDGVSGAELKNGSGAVPNTPYSGFANCEAHDE